MKTRDTIPRKREQPKPLPAPNENAGKIESRKRALSKDELVQLFMKSTEECVDLAEAFSTDAIPILLLVKEALDRDDPPDDISMRMPDGTLHTYCHVGNGAATILRWLAEELYRSWEKVDEVHREVSSVIDAIKEGKKPVLRERHS